MVESHSKGGMKVIGGSCKKEYWIGEWIGEWERVKNRCGERQERARWTGK